MSAHQTWIDSSKPMGTQKTLNHNIKQKTNNRNINCSADRSGRETAEGKDGSMFETDNVGNKGHI